MELPADVLSLPSSCESEDLPEPDELLDDVGMPPAVATAPVDFLEIFSEPRISKHAVRAGMVCAPAVDLKTGFDLLKAEDQARCVQVIQSCRPKYLMLSPPCTMFSIMQHRTNGKRKDQARFERRLCEATVLWKFALRCFNMQKQAGRRVALEHPASASSWRLECSQPLLEWSGSVVFDQCLFGLRTRVRNEPVRKRTRLMTNSPALRSCFSRRCSRETCNHFPRKHTVLEGYEGGLSRTKAAEVYPDGLCQAFVDAMQTE